MAESTPDVTAGVADDLFDKYLLPKAALGIILLASLVGTAVSRTLAGDWSAVGVAAAWLYFVALAVLTGGLLWKHGFVRPADLATDADAYCAEMYARFDRIARAALLVLVPAGGVVLRQYAAGGPADAVTWALAAALGGLVVTTAVAVRRNRPVAAAFRSPVGLLALASAVLAVGLTATAEVALRGGTAGDVAVRVLHLAAFAVWLGGAVWNIFVAVPTGQARPTTAVVRAAGEQLERFRWTVRAIIPTLLLTGLLQAAAGVGTSPGVYLGTLVGAAVLAKLGFVGVLVGIFKACPMWRACSPIDGVCDLDDLDDDRSPAATEGSADA